MTHLFPHADVFGGLIDAPREKTQALKLGDPLDEATDIGSIINNNKQFSRVCGNVEDGLNRKDARLVFGGLPPKDRSAKAILRSRPCSLTPRTTGAWRERRFSGRFWWRSPGKTRPTRSAWRMTATTASPPMSGRTISAAACVRRTRSRVAGCRSTGLWPIPWPFLRRLQAERHWPRIFARRHARELHPAQERDGEPQDAAPRIALAQA